MLVRMNSIWASPTVQARPGDIIEVADDVGKQLIDNLNAKAYVVEDPKTKKSKVKRGRRPSRNYSTGSGSDHAD